MQRLVEEESEFYFDSLEVLSAEEVGKEGKDKLISDGLDYEMWLEEPKSVDERRREFFTKMNIVENSSFDRLGELKDTASIDRGSSQQHNSDFCNREASTSGANDMIDDLGDSVVESNGGDCVSSLQMDMTDDQVKHGNEICVRKRKSKRWWEYIANKVTQRKEVSSTREKKYGYCETNVNRKRVKQIKKSCIEFSGVYEEQEFRAHNGFIWTMKFSPDGQYLATGGEDAVLRVWKIASIDSSSKPYISEGICSGENGSVRKSSVASKAPVIIPSKIFQIEESPLHEFRGHEGDILDISWFNSNLLLSSSTDETVRLWKVGSDHCLDVFRHCNYVTCVQFNPVDENMFITGSVDGKIRVWGISEKRVVDWIGAGDVITSICYRPDGDGFIVGFLTGSCRFYRYSENSLQIEANMKIQGRKRSSNRITGIQFLQDRSQKVIISCEDSKVRIFEGSNLVKKFKGLPKSGRQLSASLTRAGRHVISVGEDSRVYLWSHHESCYPSSKQRKTVRSCEHFFSQNVALAIPWSGFQQNSDFQNHNTLQTPILPSSGQDWQSFSLSTCFSSDSRTRIQSATWPEEKLPLSISPDVEGELKSNQTIDVAQSWGLVIVTAAWDGIIRTYHNYGLPVRL